MKKKGGATRKAPDGLTVSLMFRADEALRDALDEIVVACTETGDGVKYTRADVIRGMVTRCVKQDAVGSVSLAAAAKRKVAK